MSRSPDRSLVERLIEETVLAPLDRTIRTVQDLPEAVDNVRQQLVLARLVGKLAVDQGVREVRRRLDGPEGLAGGGSPRGAQAERRPPPDDDRSPAARRPPAGTASTGPDRAGTEVPAASELALPDYEQLPAAHVVAKLGGLQQSERDAIEAFELAHRHRRTILGKLDQLRQA